MGDAGEVLGGFALWCMAYCCCGPCAIGPFLTDRLKPQYAVRKFPFACGAARASSVTRVLLQDFNNAFKKRVEGASFAFLVNLIHAIYA